VAQLDHYMRVNLKPRHLQLVVALDDFRNIGQVAANASVTQPAVSKALAELERGLGVRLFERTARGVRPTIYGDCLVRHARTVIANLTQTRDELRGLMSGASGQVSIGMLSAAAIALVPAGLALFKQRSPGTTVLIREGTMESLLPELWSGKIDLIVGRLPSDSNAHGLEEKILSEEAVTLVAGPHHPLASRKRVRWADLREFPWVLPPVGALLREPLERVFERHGMPILNNRIETLSVHVIRAYLQLTDAIGVLPQDVSRHYRDLGLIVTLPLELPKLLRPVGMTWSRQRPLSPSAKLMTQCIEEAARSLKPPQVGPRHLAGAPRSATAPVAS
jgi:DNA-binding transcriptional LysR family regulator